MVYHFCFQPYHHPFKHPLKTSHGTWKVREGILLQLTNQTGQAGSGEITPLPWFGSETLEQALDFCRQLPSMLTKENIFDIPHTLPACQFGFETAWEQIAGFRFQVSEFEEQPINSALVQSALLPAGEGALSVWKKLWQAGYRTFKWKIGVEALEIELALLERLAHDLPKAARLRLDANGGLSMETAKAWLAACDRISIIEYLEQPLPPSQFAQMLELSGEYSTPLALDESVATLAQLEECYSQGWRGIFVIKPAIAGSPRCLRQFFQVHAIDAVFSSVFETDIGRQAGLKLAAELGNRDRAMGYGTEHWFDECRIKAPIL